MDDQQMDQWFGDKLRQEQDFEFHDSDWDAVAEKLDQDRSKRRIAWFWWPIAGAFALLLGLFFWQQEQITALQAQLDHPVKIDTVHKTIVIQDTIWQQSSSNNLASIANNSKKLTPNPSTPTKQEILIDVSNSSVVKSRAQLTAVDSTTESPVFFNGHPKADQMTNQQLPKEAIAEQIPSTPLKPSTPLLADGASQEKAKLNPLKSDETVFPWEKLTTQWQKLPVPNKWPEELAVSPPPQKTSPITQPKTKGRPVFVADLSVGYGKPNLSKVDKNLDQSQSHTGTLGLGLSWQPIKKWWVRAGVAYQSIRYRTADNVDATTYAQTLDLFEDLSLDSRDTLGVPASTSINSIFDRQRYFQYELGIRYDWLEKGAWLAYAKGDITGQLIKKRKTTFNDQNGASNAAVFGQQEKISSQEKEFSLSHLQLGVGLQYRTKTPWSFFAEGNWTQRIGSTNQNDLSPLWDSRLGVRYQF